MRKTTIAILAVFTIIATIGVASATTKFYTEIQGNNTTFEINTHTKHAYDSFYGEGKTLHVWQTTQIGETKKWAGDGEDIDRYGEFYNGCLQTEIDWDSLGTHSWDWGHSRQYSGVTSNEAGYLGQNLHFGLHWGGVKDVDQWKKQRDMMLGAEGEYSIYFGADDLRADNWGFYFDVAGEGNADLYVDSAYSTYQHNPGPPWYGPYDGYNIKGERGNTHGFELTWNGDITRNIFVDGNRGVDFTEYVDFTNGFNFGTVEIR